MASIQDRLRLSALLEKAPPVEKRNQVKIKNQDKLRRHFLNEYERRDKNAQPPWNILLLTKYLRAELIPVLVDVADDVMRSVSPVISEHRPLLEGFEIYLSTGFKAGLGSAFFDEINIDSLNYGILLTVVKEIKNR